MTSSATSTERREQESAASFHPWHFFLLLSMAGATAAVIVSRETHPAALLLLSAAVICAGLVAIALTQAVSGFFRNTSIAPLTLTAREVLEREKTLVLRSIKELEFDKAMGKVSDADFAEISGRLRARAITLMQDLERAPEESAAPAPVARAGRCPRCETQNDADARFCKNCGNSLPAGRAVRL
ncbi:MAG TPA: zinc ribbon domain-containing protein [Vicinamibacterales bacterium]|nr:zinc ribbon domain-containing protein [Vicinamibacterales bacterium]